MANQDLLDTPLNAPNAEQNIFDAVKPAQAPVVPDYFNQALDIQQGVITPSQQVALNKQQVVDQKRREKLARFGADAAYYQDPVQEYDDLTKARILEGQDNAVEFSVDQAQKMVGAGIRTFGDLFGSKSAEEWGQDIIDQQEYDIAVGNYQSEYNRGSLRETFNEDGFSASLGYIWEKMLENSASSGAALGGGLLAALTAPFSASAAAVMGGATFVGSTLLGAGETALEMEEMGVDVDAAKAAGVGTIIGLLDKFGAGKVIPKNLLKDMSGDQIVNQLAKRGYENAALAFAKELAKKGMAEVGTEMTQEGLIMGAAASEGAQYTQQEIIDRMIDTAFISLGMTTTPAVATTTIQQAAKGAGTVIDSAKEALATAAKNIEERQLSETDRNSAAWQAIRAAEEFSTLDVSDIEAVNEASARIGTLIKQADKEIADGTYEVSDTVAGKYESIKGLRDRLEQIGMQQFDGTNEVELGTRLAEAFQTGVEKTFTPEEHKKLKEDILFSMRTSDFVTVEQADQVLEKMDLTSAERTTVEQYKQRKVMAEVAGDVQFGEGAFRGAKQHAQLIHAAIQQNNPEKARTHLEELRNFTKYQKMKADAFEAVQRANEGDKKAPKGVTVLSRNEDGTIKDFAVDNEFGFGYNDNGTRKRWTYQTPGQTRSLVRQVRKEEAYLRNLYRMARDSGIEAFKDQATQPTQKPTKKHAEKLSESKAAKGKQDYTLAQIKAGNAVSIEDASTLHNEGKLSAEDKKTVAAYIQANRKAAEPIQETVEAPKKQAKQKKQAKKAKPKSKPVQESVQVAGEVRTTAADHVRALIPSAKVITTAVQKVTDKLVLKLNDFTTGINVRVRGWGRSPAEAIQNIKQGLVDGATAQDKRTLALLDNFHSKFVNHMGQILAQTKDGVQDFHLNNVEYQQKDLFAMFMSYYNVDGKVHGVPSEEVTGAMVTTLLEWIGTQGSRTIYNDNDAINSILGRDSKHPVNDEEVRALRTAGTSKPDLAQSLGNQVMRVLGIKMQETAPETMQNRMALSIGMVMLDTMTHAGLAEQKSISLGKLKGDTKDEATSQWVRIKANKKLEPVKALENIIKAYSEGTAQTSAIVDVLEKMTGRVMQRKKLPGKKARRLGKESTMKDGETKLTKDMIKEMNYAQSVPWVIRPEMLDAIRNIASRQKLYIMMGYRTDAETVPKYMKDSVIGKNRSIVQQVDDALDFIKQLQDSGQEQFFYTYGFANNTRNMVNETNFSYQASKFVRHLIKPLDPKTKEDAFTAEYDLTNKKHLQAFQASIVLAFEDLHDLKIDRSSPEAIAQKFDEKFGVGRRSTIARAAIKARDGKPFIDLLLSDPSIEWDGNGMQIIDGVVALGEYYKALKNADTTFKASLPIELDAITSGTGIGYYNFGIHRNGESAKAEAAGINTTGDTYVEHMAKTGGQDNYLMLIKPWQDAIANLPPVLGPVADMVKHFAGSLKRSDAKDPVMLSNYQAQANSLKNMFADRTIEKMYQQLFSDDINVRRAAVQQLNAIFEFDWSTVDSKAKPHKVQKITRLNKSFEFTASQRSKLRKVINHTYGDAMITALEGMNAEFSKVIGQSNINFNVLFAVYQTRLKELEAKYRTNKGEISNKHRKIIMEHPDLVKLRPLIYIEGSETADQALYLGKRDEVRTYDTEKDDGAVTQVAYSFAQGVNIDGRSSRGYATITEDASPGLAGGVRQTQERESRAMRKILGSVPIMSVFDGIYTNPLHLEEVGGAYNKGWKEANEAYSMYEGSMQALETALSFLKGRKDQAKYWDAIVEAAFLDPEVDTLKSITKKSKAVQKQVKEDRAAYHPEVIVVDHLGVAGTAFRTDEYISATDTAEQAAEQFIDDLFESILGGTAGTNIDPDTFRAQDSDYITGDTVNQIFDTLGTGSRRGNVQETAAHTNRLSSLLDRVVSPLLNKMGGIQMQMRRDGNFNQGAYDRGIIYMDLGLNSPIYASDLSEKTLYAHELIHAITFGALGKKDNHQHITDIVELRNALQDHLKKTYGNKPWKVFLKRDGRGEPVYLTDQKSEEKQAQEMYKYVFGNSGRRIGDNQLDASIYEFVAHGLTHPALAYELAGMTFRPRKHGGRSAWTHLRNIFSNLAHALMRAMGKMNNIQGDKALEQMVFNLHKTQHKYSTTSQKIAGTIQAANDSVTKTFVNKILLPINRYTAEKAITGGKAAQHAAAVVGATLPSSFEGQQEMFQGKLHETRRRWNIARDNIILSIFKSIIGPNSPTEYQLEQLLLKSKQAVDKARDAQSMAVRKEVNESFLTKVSEEEWIAITQSTLRTDLPGFLEGLTQENYTQVVDILRNTNGKRRKEIAKLMKELKQQGAMANYYINQARSLGHFMAKGTALVKEGRLNATAIAQTVIDNVQGPKDQALAIKQIDKLATLFAVDYTQADSNRITADVMEREFQASRRTNNPESNGMSYLLYTQAMVKSDALKDNFGGNAILMVKGHIRDITDPNMSVVVAPAADELAMKKKGYKLQSRLAHDSADKNAGQQALYTSSSRTLQEFHKATISTTGTHALGSSVMQRAKASGAANGYKNGKLEVGAIKTTNQSDIANQLASSNYTSTGTVLVPTINENNDIIDYRYTMNHHTKETYMNQDLRADVVLGAMAGNIVDKSNSEKLNKEVIDALKADVDQNYHKDSTDYVVLSANSANKEHAELYRLLPEATRHHAEKVFGKKGITIRSDYIGLVFGQRALSVSKLPFMDHHTVRTLEAIWQEIVALAKKNIVIKTGEVLLYNVFSNTVFGVLNGVPPTFMIKRQFQHAKNIHQYQNNVRDLNRLKNRARVAKRQNDISQAMEIEGQMAALQSLIESSPVHELVKANMFQSIIEDLDASDDPYKFTSKFNKKVDRVFGNSAAEGLGKGARGVYNQLYMTDDTTVFKLLMKATQYSDFVARQTIYEYKVEQGGMSKEEAKELVLRMFINYELPDHRAVQYLNDNGLLMFTKYPMRIIRAIVNTFRGNPLNIIALSAVEDFFNVNLSDPLDTNYGTQITTPFEIFDSVTTLSGYELATKVTPL